MNIHHAGSVLACAETAPMRWEPAQVPEAHALPLVRVLDLLGAPGEREAVRRMLHFLGTTVGAGEARAVEHVLHGATLKTRQSIASHACTTGEDEADPRVEDALVTLAKRGGDQLMVCVCGGVGVPEAVRAQRLSLLYTTAPGTAWALHFRPTAPRRCFSPADLASLLPCAFLVLEIHRIVTPAASEPADRVNSAEVRLGVRAPGLSGRERQVCARIAVGQSAASIAADLGIAASTVITLRKRAYEKLAIHGRLDLRQLAA